MSTWLFIPGSKERHVQKALDVDADVIIFDLEDAVTVHEKDEARSAVSRALDRMEEKKCYVRVNGLHTDECLDDISELVGPNLDGVVLPMVHRRDDVLIADFFIQKIERRKGLKKGAIQVVPLIETAQGVVNALDIAQSSERIRCLAFGAEDYMLDMNIVPDEEESELLHARSTLVTASRVAKIEPPIDSVFVDFHDEEGLIESTNKGKRLGFGAKLLIHPRQIDTVNRIYAPTDKEIEQAKQIVKAYEAGVSKGDGAVQLNGEMIDKPVVDRARRILANVEKY